LNPEPLVLEDNEPYNLISGALYSFFFTSNTSSSFVSISTLQHYAESMIDIEDSFYPVKRASKSQFTNSCAPERLKGRYPLIP